MSKGRRLPPGTFEKIVAQTQSGLSYDHVAEQFGISWRTVEAYHAIAKAGYASPTEYMRERITRNGFASFKEYHTHLKNTPKKQAHLPVSKPERILSNEESRLLRASDHGFASYPLYQQWREEQKSLDPTYKLVAHIVKLQLQVIHHTSAWLAEQTHYSKSFISKIVHAKRLPGRHNQERFFSILGLPYKTIEDIPYSSVDDISKSDLEQAIESKQGDIL